MTVVTTLKWYDRFDLWLSRHGLAQLTGNVLPAAFIAGDALGSFNSIARWVSDALFGVGLAWYLRPFAEGVFAYRRAELLRPGQQ